MYCYRIKKYIGAYFAALGGVNALVFTGGIGENSASIRQHVCAGLGGLGIEINNGKNNTKVDDIADIQKQNAAVKIFVIRTNEELEIARQTLTCIQARAD